MSRANGSTKNQTEQGLLSRLRARLQPCRNIAQKQGALAPEVRSFKLFRSHYLQAVLVCCLAIVMLGAGDTSEKRYERTGHNLMCACGCGQVLLECNHVSCPSSGPMTIELKQQLAAGGSDKTVLNWFVEKYGATVLAAPLRGGFDNVAWITPISVFLLAILGTAMIIRVWKSRSPKHVPIKIAGMSEAKTDELRDRIRRETIY